MSSQSCLGAVRRANPLTSGDACARLADEGAVWIDLNVGCPVKKFIRNCAGSALLRDLPRAAAIVRAIRAAELPRILADHPGVSYSLEGEQRRQNETIAALALNTLRSEFPHVRVFRAGSDDLVLASMQPIGREDLAAQVAPQLL